MIPLRISAVVTGFGGYLKEIPFEARAHNLIISSIALKLTDLSLFSLKYLKSVTAWIEIKVRPVPPLRAKIAFLAHEPDDPVGACVVCVGSTGTAGTNGWRRACWY